MPRYSPGNEIETDWSPNDPTGNNRWGDFPAQGPNAMPNDSTALRLLPQLRRVVLARDSATGDGQLLASFVASRDESAFAALVRRHGPMVLGVCRRVVGDPHLAEDAFQATFLVLARRAAAVRPRSLVGNWLSGVANRTALRARAAAARGRAKEKQVDAMPHPPVSVDQAWADLQPVLDSELARLPDKFRMPIVLCDLNGRPQRDVARELKLPPATLANRLAAARRLLAKRLTRGVTCRRARGRGPGMLPHPPSRRRWRALP